LFEKIEVNGPNAHEVFKFLRVHSDLNDAKVEKGKKAVKEIPWNFAKFLVDE